MSNSLENIGFYLSLGKNMENERFTAKVLIFNKKTRPMLAGFLFLSFYLYYTEFLII